MKVIHFIYSLDPGGAERLVVDLSNEMVQLNHEVNLCTRQLEGKREEKTQQENRPCEQKTQKPPSTISPE